MPLEAIFRSFKERLQRADDLTVSLTTSAAGPITGPPDDKIEALVGLVLRAVDQRLGVVRDQIAEVANSVARHHADLQVQIDACRESITISRDQTRPASDAALTPAADADGAASAALLAAANLLTERVGSLESRLHQYTDAQVGRLEAIIARGPVVTPPTVVAPATMTPLMPAAPVAAGSATVAPTTGPIAGPINDGFDIEAFSAQLNARLSALVEKAIAT